MAFTIYTIRFPVLFSVDERLETEELGKWQGSSVSFRAKNCRGVLLESTTFESIYQEIAVPFDFQPKFPYFLIFVKMISTLVNYGLTPSPIPRREFSAGQVRQVISGTHRVALVILELTFSAAGAALQRSQ